MIFFIKCDNYITYFRLILLIFFNYHASYSQITMKKSFILILLISFITTSCGIYKRADVKDVPVNVNERVERNIKTGRGITFGSDNKSGGVFDFASSNEMWRASMEILDFVTFANASYSGGIIITDWFSNDNSENNNAEFKITVKFLSNEIRADGLNVNIHQRECKIIEQTNRCTITKIKSNLENEIKLAILKKAARIEKGEKSGKIDSFKKKLSVNRNN